MTGATPGSEMHQHQLSLVLDNEMGLDGSEILAETAVGNNNNRPDLIQTNDKS